MANPLHIAELQKGVAAWNHWRRENKKIKPDLSGADLIGMDLTEVDLREAKLYGAKLIGAKLIGADLIGAKLSEANLNRAYLSEAKLDRAYLSRATLHEADLCKADLSEAYLGEADLCKADLREAYLIGAYFSRAYLRGADLRGAYVSRANFSQANLSEANLSKANFSQANLSEANLCKADLTETKLGGATFGETLFLNVNLSSVQELDSCRHCGPSAIDHRTIALSVSLPLVFLRGCGLPEALITYLPSLSTQAIEFYSCFISYSTKDQDFADRLYADLQNKGVRCWFAPHNIQGGKKIHEQIDEAIRVYDRLLLILSEASMSSEWVQTEIAKARKRELHEKRRMLFPVRLVSFETLKKWECFDADAGKDSAREIREYFVPDFSNWKDYDSYQNAFEQLLKDLKSDGNHKAS